MKVVTEEEIIENDIGKLVNEADVLINNTIKKVNYELINMYWNIGKLIVEYRKEHHSKYKDYVVKRFSEELYLKYGSGFGEKNIKSSINLFCVFEKRSPATQFKNICWSHYREIINSKNKKIILFYLEEVEKKHLTRMELRKYIKSHSFERTIANQKQGKINHEIDKTLKSPLILNIENKKRSEKQLENDIINNISEFKKEIGDVVTFFERQYKLNIQGLIHRIDLIFYDIKTNTFILIDLKVSKINNHDVSQMKLYLKHFKMEINNKSNVIGLILCECNDMRIETDPDIYQIRYLNEIPKDKELLSIISENKIILLKCEKLGLK